MSYGEVQGKTWRNPSVRGLSDSHKLAWSYLLSNQHSNMIGYYLLPIPYMADDLEWSTDRTKKAIKTLERRGLIAYDYAAQIVFVCKYLKYNHLPSGRREEGGINRAEELPESPLLSRLLAAVVEWHPKLTKLRAYLQNRSHGVGLFGLQVESGKSHAAPLDTDTVIEQEEDRATDHQETDVAIDYLNELAGTSFRHSKHSREPIHARLSEGSTLDDVKIVFDWKAAQWLGDPKWEPNLTPGNLCKPTTWEGNVNAARKWIENGRPALSEKADVGMGTERGAAYYARRKAKG